MASKRNPNHIMSPAREFSETVGQSGSGGSGGSENILQNHFMIPS